MDVYVWKGHPTLTTVGTPVTPGWSDQSFERSSKVLIGFSKPDSPTINKKRDGFRKPSSYKTVPFYKVNGRSVSSLPIIYNLSGMYETTSGRPLWRYTTSGTGYGSFQGRFHSGPNVNEVRTKILNNIKDEIFDATMVLGELQGTVNTVSSNLHRIGRSMAALKRGNPRHFYYLLTGKTHDNRRPTQKFLKESSGLFLEWKYGINPSVMDLQGALHSMRLTESGEFWDQPPLLVARSSSSVESTIRGSINVADARNQNQAKVDVFVKNRVEYKARCDYRIKASGLRDLNRYGIGLGSIATLAWDKHPFTFVLDMVIPIADIIKAWSALSGTKVVGYCETRYESKSVVATSGVTPGTHPHSYSILPYELPSFTRQAFSSPPMPVPYVKNPIKTGNLATVLALFTQLRKSA